MKSINIQMRDAIDAIEREKVASYEVIGFSAYRYAFANVQVTDEAIIRLYHQLKIARSALKAEAEDGYLHVSFKHRGINWCACVRLEKAAMFIDSQQRQLPAPKSRPKHIGNDQRRLAFVGGDER